MLRYFTLFVFAASLFAQIPVGPPPDMPLAPPPGAMGALREALSLDDSQVEMFFALRRERAQTMRSLHEELASRERVLGEMLKAGNTDAAAIGKQVLSIEAQRKLIRDTDESFRTRALAVLTAAQTTKLEDLKQALKLERAVREAIGLQLISPPQPLQPAPISAPRRWAGPGQPQPR